MSDVDVIWVHGVDERGGGGRDGDERGADENGTDADGAAGDGLDDARVTQIATRPSSLSSVLGADSNPVSRLLPPRRCHTTS